MITFWLICAFLVAIALAFALFPPLLQAITKKSNEGSRKQSNIAVYRDQSGELDADLRNGIISREQHEQDHDELERRMLEDISVAEPEMELANAASGGRGAVYAVALGIPLLAIALYFRVGSPKSINAPPPGGQVSSQGGSQPTSPMDASGQVSQQQIEANVAKLAKRLEQNPKDVQGWSMLGGLIRTLKSMTKRAKPLRKRRPCKPITRTFWQTMLLLLLCLKARSCKANLLN